MESSLDPTTLILLLIPFILLDLIMKIAALISISRAERVRGHNKLLWVLVVLLVNMLGWVIWFMAGKEE